MFLLPGGIDVFYIDESHDNKLYVVTAIRVPFLRNIDGIWTITWGAHLTAAKAWRRRMKENDQIPVNKELHGWKLASGRGNYKKGKHNFDRAKAGAVYRRILADADFLPEESVMSACAPRGKYLYGNERAQAALYALFQRIRSQCRATGRNGLMFFDEGHPEYRQLYRQACVYLPTGSRYELSPRNLPLDMFAKDGNYKNSKHCYFTQFADLVAYAAFLKVKSESDQLTDWQKTYSYHNLYDTLLHSLPNRKVSGGPKDGIVRLK